MLALKLRKLFLATAGALNLGDENSLLRSTNPRVRDVVANSYLQQIGDAYQRQQSALRTMNARGMWVSEEERKAGQEAWSRHLDKRLGNPVIAERSRVSPWSPDGRVGIWGRLFGDRNHIPMRDHAGSDIRDDNRRYIAGYKDLPLDKRSWLRKYLGQLPDAPHPRAVLAHIIRCLPRAAKVMTLRTGRTWGHKDLARLELALRSGRYRWHRSKQVWIESPKGNARPLSVPTPEDRLVSLAILMGCTRHIKSARTTPKGFTKVNRGFSRHSWALPCRGTIRQLDNLLAQKRGYIVALDIKGYFPSLPRDLTAAAFTKLTGQTHWKAMCLSNLRRTEIKQALPEWASQFLANKGKALPSYQGGERVQITGVPQGDPMSVINSNMIGHLVDGYIERHCQKWHCRYIDDINVMCPSRRSAHRFMRGITKFLADLGLEVSPLKTVISDGSKEAMRSFRILGFHVAWSKELGRWELWIPTETAARVWASLTSPSTTPEQFRGLLGYWFQGRSEDTKLDLVLAAYRAGEETKSLQRHCNAYATRDKLEEAYGVDLDGATESPGKVLHRRYKIARAAATNLLLAPHHMRGKGWHQEVDRLSREANQARNELSQLFRWNEYVPRKKRVAITEPPIAVAGTARLASAPSEASKAATGRWATYAMAIASVTTILTCFATWPLLVAVGALGYGLIERWRRRE